MDKYTWRQVKTLSSSSHKPSSRWGHSSCVVGQEIVFFGGYADSNYMNDVWAFNSITMKWREVETFGDIPCHRSNCSMNYDKENDQIVIFGGGGSNKQRFNSISILDWKTKTWLEIAPKQNEVAPWERTYHAAELISPYLVVYGGQGVADLNDLWVFSFITLSWTEVKIPEQKIKPCARRFHSSVTVGNQFIIIAGCHGKYRCLSDVFSVDLTSLLKTGSFQQLQWKQKQLKNSSFLTRWGHSSQVYDNKIYIFGGRFSNDLNDLLMIDLESSTIKMVKTMAQPPQARRRHCAGFIGSSMLVFGGFNGQYFQDLNFISVHEPKTKYDLVINWEQKIIRKYLNNAQIHDYSIKTTFGEDFYINVGFVTKYFQTEIQLEQFLQSMRYFYSTEQLQEIFVAMYNGYGEIKTKNQHTEIILPMLSERRQDRLDSERQKIQKKVSDPKNSILKKAVLNQSPIIKLPAEDFVQYYFEQNTKSMYDCQLIIGKNKYLVTKVKLMAKSDYFFNLLSKLPSIEPIQLPNLMQDECTDVYKVFFNFLQTDWLILPDNASSQTFAGLTFLAGYFCVPILEHTCCNQLLNIISPENVQILLDLSTNLKLTNVTKACSDFWIRKNSQSTKIVDMKAQIKKAFGDKNKITEGLENMLQKIAFDLAQNIMEIQKMLPNFQKKKDSIVSMEKQNFQSNIYNQ